MISKKSPSLDTNNPHSVLISDPCNGAIADFIIRLIGGNART